MDNVSDVRLGPLPADSPYMKPFRLYYTQCGKEKNWGKRKIIKFYRFAFQLFFIDLVKAHDSVAVILFNVTRNKLVLVKQFRPAVYYGLICEEFSKTGRVDLAKFPPRDAITLELCAGIVDKDMSVANIAREELIEECGYDVSVERIEEVMRYRSGVGTTGSLQTLFYCEVTDSDKVIGQGGGVDDEIIEVCELSIEEAQELMKQGSSHTSPPSFLFGILWFLTNKLPKQQQ